MQKTKTFKLFDSLYDLHYDLKDEDLLIPFLQLRPTLNEFEDYCWSWNIKYKINYIGEKK